MKTEKQLTAVEWIVEQYEQKIGKGISSVMADEIKQAKAMEKEQIIDFAEDYEINESEKYPQKTFEQYYKETYESKNSKENKC